MLGCSDQASHIPERSSATAKMWSKSEGASVEVEAERLLASRLESASHPQVPRASGHLKLPNQQTTVAFMDCSQCFPIYSLKISNVCFMSDRLKRQWNPALPGQ